MKCRSVRVARRLILAVVLCIPAANGQAVTGSLLGVVTDASGSAAPNAKVVIVETNTGIQRSAITNQTGFYSFPGLESGTYSVSVELAGFRRVTRTDTKVFVNTTVRADFVLEPGVVNQAIDVIASATDLQTDRADTGRIIETKQVQDLPLPFGRNFQGLLNLVPGAGRAFRPNSEFYNAQDSLSSRVNGQSYFSNNVQLEGIDNNFRTGQLTVVIPPIEAVETVDVSTSNYEAELGRAGGAVTNVTLRSGTNELHGSVFEFNRVSLLAARNVFAQSKAPSTYNLYGFTLGGPIRKNRTFIFGDYQGIKDRRGDVFLATIPTLEFRNGDLSGSSTIIYDPRTGTPDGRGREPFAGNQIPANRISPIARRILALVPPPTFTGFQTNFQKNTVRRKDSDSFDVKLDHLFTDRDRFFVRYSFQKAAIEDPPLFGLAGGGGKSFAGSGSQLSQNGALNYTHIFSPAFIMELRAGVNRHRNDANNADLDTNASAAIGIPGINISPVTGGLTTINVDGFSNPLVGYSASLPWKKAETAFNFVGNWTVISGNHTVKWGADVRRMRDDNFQNQTFGPRGVFQFTAGPTALNGNANTSFANAFASFLLDAPNSIGRDLSDFFPAARQTAVFSYIQDKWQVLPKLTLDIGLRHELWPPPTPRLPGGFSNYDPANNTLLVAGVGSVPMNLGRKTYWNELAPRFGLAYRFNQKTVFRAGYGISIIPLDDPSNNVTYNFPVRQTNSFPAPNSFSTGGSMAAGLPPPQEAVIPADGIIRNAPDQAYTFQASNVKEGYAQSWNVSAQRALPASFTMDVAYVGVHGIRVPVRRDVNAALTPGSGSAGQPLFQRFGRRASAVDLYYPTSTIYHSLQVKFDHRFTGGFMLTTAYTYGKAIDLATDHGTLQIPIYPSLNRARSNSDITHVFVQSYIYELPFGPNRRWLRSGPARWILGNWQVNGIFTAQTGTPLDFTFSSTTLNAPGNINRPNVTGTPTIFGDVGRNALWFEVSRFSTPAVATFGNVGRNVLTGPGLVNLDLSIFRKFVITERVRAEFRFESFNFTNTPHFNNPGTVFGNPNFGQVTTAQADQRSIQFGLKLSF
jgi:hypothetical protein